MVTFFDLVTFFGVASFFAWLAYAPLQSDQLDKFKGKNRKRAGDNFAAINDYFLVSFLGFALAATCDYLSQVLTDASFLGLVSTASSLGIFAGITGLLWAMLYVRMIVKADRTWYSIDPPGFLFTYLFFGVTVVMVYVAAQFSMTSSFALDKFLWFCEMFVAAWGGWRVIRYHDETDWRVRGKRRGIVGLAALILVPILLGTIVVPLLRIFNL
jgi:hypothetical protein